jgi:hypothetical protein
MCSPSYHPYSDPMFRSRLTPEELASLGDDPDSFYDLLYDQGQDVFVIGWDGRAPGAGGAEWLKEFRGIYVWFSSDLGLSGPFESLSEALGNGIIDTFCDNHRVESSTMSPDELKRYVHERFDLGGNETIVINNEPYRWTESGFVPCDWSEIG